MRFFRYFFSFPLSSFASMISFSTFAHLSLCSFVSSFLCSHFWFSFIPLPTHSFLPQSLPMIPFQFVFYSLSVSLSLHLSFPVGLSDCQSPTLTLHSFLPLFHPLCPPPSCFFLKCSMSPFCNYVLSLHMYHILDLDSQALLLFVAQNPCRLPAQAYRQS